MFWFQDLIIFYIVNKQNNKKSAEIAKIAVLQNSGGGTAVRQTQAYSGLLWPTPAYSSLSQQNYPCGVVWSRLE
jgi:hypothetical protein